MTPADFSAITGIPSGVGEALMPDFGLHLDREAVEDLLVLTP